MTKHRQGLLDADMLARREHAPRKVCGDFGAGLREFNGDDDHAHLLVHYPPKVSVSAQRRWSQFTGRVNRHTMHWHLWSPSCFAASCGGAPQNIICQYIDQ